MAKARKRKGWEKPEFVLAKKNKIEVRTAQYPDDAEYVRIVDCRGEVERELMYWHSDEWQEDGDLSCIGAIFAAIGSVRDGTLNPDEEMYQRHADSEAEGDEE